MSGETLLPPAPTWNLMQLWVGLGMAGSCWPGAAANMNTRQRPCGRVVRWQCTCGGPQYGGKLASFMAAATQANCLQRAHLFSRQQGCAARLRSTRFTCGTPKLPAASWPTRT